MFDVNILYTGSNGNVTIIDDCIMIDIGKAYKHVEAYLPKIDKIFITHRHGDHLKPTALTKLRKVMPWKVENGLYMNADTFRYLNEKRGNHEPFDLPKERLLKSHSPTVKEFDFDNELEPHIYEFSAGGRDYKLETFWLDHDDVENQGFVITNDQNETLIFATDTATMKMAPAIKYDYIVVEGNYDVDKIYDAYVNGSDNEAFRALRNMRHLSIQDFWQFVRGHSHPKTKVYQLHESDQFGVTNKIEHINTADFEEAQKALKF